MMNVPWSVSALCDWIDPYLNAYKQVYPNLMKHDSEYPTLVNQIEFNLIMKVRFSNE